MAINWKAKSLRKKDNTQGIVQSRKLDKSQTRKLDKKPLKQTPTYSYLIEMRKVVFASSIILLFSILLLNEVTNANPFGPGPYSPTEPIKDPPIIMINSPQNTTYYQNSIPLSITIIQPDSWDASKKNYTLGNTNTMRLISYEIDGQPFTLWNGTRRQLIGTSYTVNYALPKNSEFTAILNVSNGQHRLQVNVQAISLYFSEPFFPFEDKYIIETSQSIAFLVEPNLSVIPSLATDLPSNQMVPAAIASAIVIIFVAVVSVPLVYYRRRKGKP